MYTYFLCDSDIKIRGVGSTFVEAKTNAKFQLCCKHLDRKKNSCFVYNQNKLVFKNLSATFRFKNEIPDYSLAFKFRVPDLDLTIFELFS